MNVAVVLELTMTGTNVFGQVTSSDEDLEHGGGSGRQGRTSVRCFYFLLVDLLEFQWGTFT